MLLTQEAAIAQLDEIDATLIEKFLKELPEKAMHLGIRILLALIFFMIGVQCIKFLIMRCRL